MAINNNAGSVFNLTGNVGGTLGGGLTFTNSASAGGFGPAQFNFSGTRTFLVAGSTFTNNGTIQASAPTDQLTLNGNFNSTGGNTGNINMLVTAADANLVRVGGTSAGTQNINFTLQGGVLPVYMAPRTVLDLNGGSLTVSNRGLVPQLSNGLLNNFLVQNGGGSDAYLQSVFNDGPISGVSSGISSIVAALTSGFFQAASAIVSRPDNPRANQIGGGPFVRVAAGDATTNLDSTISAFGPSTTSTTNASVNFSGLQAGFDVGVYNIDSSDWNVNLGVFGGYVNARSFSTTNTPTPIGGTSLTSTSVNMDVPYVALYTFISKRSFNAEINVRKDFYNGNVTSYNGDLTVAGGYMVAPNTKLTGQGTSVNAIVSNRFDINDTIYVEPLAGLTWGRYTFDDVYFNPALGASGTSGRISLAPIESWLGRVGANFGGTFLISDNIAVAPFVHTSIWHEFAGNTSSTAYVGFNNLNFAFPLATERVNTFGQVGLGAQFKILSMDLMGFVRGDMRFGDNLNGKALNIGIRKQF
jgi:outer membrane autotransporter protein